MKLRDHVWNYVSSRGSCWFSGMREETVMMVAFILGLIVVSAVPDISVAQTAGPSALTDAICNVVEYLTGPIGRGVAAIAVIFVGFSLFLGKISWGLAIAIGMGIAAIFGANQIVGFFSPGGQQACRTATGTS